MQKDLVDHYEADKLHLRQLEDVDEINVFGNHAIQKFNKFYIFLFHIEFYNLNRDDCFINKIREIKRDVERQDDGLVDLIEVAKNELYKDLSPERIQKFYQFEADESHVGSQCQVCLEEAEVGRLMKQLDCGGRHSFCSVCIDQWFANHKTCPICRHIFV